uniref:uncharacterized protein LOC130493940 n=1 Tax=Euleptes europaea TaxID=460621 RepID=UPI002541DC6B|nr:uncharacterized protein LOC130493940 [Euleptes europaea]
MASGSPSTDLEEELNCPICLECLTEPVTLDCGHNFCRGCITHYCDTWEELGGLECPICKAEIQKGNFRSNWQLANLVEKIKEKRFSRPEERGRVCQKHLEPLNLFCKDDEALICVVCHRSKEHRDHEALPLEEASQEYKDQFYNRLEVLKKERERIVAYKAEVVKESQDLLEQTSGEKQETAAKFRQLHSFLEEQEKRLLAQMEEVEKEVARNRDQHLAALSEELSSLDSLIQEMEEKCQQPASELLQDPRSTLQRYEEKEAFEDPAAFPLALKWRIWELTDLNPLLEGIKKQFKDTLDSGLHLQKANVTLDPDTAHPLLVLSEDRESLRCGEIHQDLPDNPERFSTYGAVLGREGFTAGRHFWEVLVGSEETWLVGVARKSVRRKGDVTFSHEEGFWAVGKWCGCYRAALKGINPPLTGEPKRIRVCLNYAGGRVAFLDADQGSPIYEFSRAAFRGETLLPFFWVFEKGHLKLAEAAMAWEGPLQELCEEASCSVCLDYFRDPVMIAECGHNFCRACLTGSWGASRAEASCPQCRGRAQEGSLRPNQQLANLVGLIQQLSPREKKAADVTGGEGKGGACEKHQEPLKFVCKEDEAPLCVVCRRCKEHQDHQVIPLEEEIKQIWFFCFWHQTIKAARKERVCQKHKESLKLFCKDDETPICVVCDQSQEHNDHKIIPVEEASQEYKDQFCNCMEILRKEKKEILAYKANIVKESQDLLKQTKGERQETVTKFRQLHKFLDKQEKLLLTRMEEVEREVAWKRDQRLAKLSEALSSLESLIREMEEKCQQPASELLQDARSILQRYEEKEAFEEPVAFLLALKSRIWDLPDLNPLLENIKEQFKDTLDSGLHLQKANVTLDPDTAHPKLVLSEDQKTVRLGEKAQALPSNPERFDEHRAVLGREGFTAGRHFWEVLVGSEEGWRVGVARKSVRRKGYFAFSPEEGIWAVGKWWGCYRAATKGQNLPLTLTGEPKRIRVCLDYDGGRVAFFDADRGSLIYEFSGAPFRGEILLPFFRVWGQAHLKLSS